MIRMANKRKALVLAAAIFQLIGPTPPRATALIVSDGPPAEAQVAPILEAFVSYSIEFSSFPDFAGNNSHPNTFSNNLLNNLGNLTGTKPYIRVGGNTQDYALYNADLKIALQGTIVPSRAQDYPTVISIGPSYFESYNTWPDTKYIHGFNMGLGGNTSAGWQTLIDTVPLACQALGKEKLLWWEYGNEPDLFSTSSQGAVRPPTWNESTYVDQWLNATRMIKVQLQKYCPDLVENGSYGYLAPSFAGLNNHLKPVKTWQAGLDVDKSIKVISSHNYIGGATQPGVTLQGTLLNHSVTVRSVDAQAQLGRDLSYTGLPFILGETNSLYNQGKPGLSNAFGAALWGIDFNLYSASVGIQRVHMHMGTNYRYQAWQPIHTNITTIGTKPPYYGQIVVAAMLGSQTEGATTITNIPTTSSHEAIYTAYAADSQLARVAIINMRQYNYTINGTSSVPNPVPRPSVDYELQLPEGFDGTEASVKRLVANGSDAITGISWDGVSYNWELDEGRPVRLGNVTTGEKVRVEDGLVRVSVPDSEAVILEL
ncbi:hypothetical protein HYFRA_00006401 [Hymenoscyphus fraxineus]|uniref:Beta-glucuronidase C-terminal domain-containing protein n=1 Tax=Hymenoscyphus fraxineus TaxID=746836 RepID=A0A9N9PFX9_9HELO|nr:hypothetical protein HYFRA_00006401 [Hymenoscyphus fraxineus]